MGVSRYRDRLPFSFAVQSFYPIPYQLSLSFYVVISLASTKALSGLEIHVPEIKGAKPLKENPSHLCVQVPRLPAQMVLYLGAHTWQSPSGEQPAAWCWAGAGGPSISVEVEEGPQGRKFLVPKDQDEKWSQWFIFI